MSKKMNKKDLNKAEELIRKTDLNEEMKKLQENQKIGETLIEPAKEDVWVISDSSSKFSSLNFNNG